MKTLDNQDGEVIPETKFTPIIKKLKEFYADVKEDKRLDEGIRAILEFGIKE